MYEHAVAETSERVGDDMAVIVVGDGAPGPAP